MTSFINGFLYFFGLSDNPIDRYYKEQKEQNNGLSGFEIDAYNLHNDWRRVGMDIKKAYEKETSTAF